MDVLVGACCLTYKLVVQYGQYNYKIDICHAPVLYIQNCHSWRIEFVCKPAIIYNLLNNHVAKMVVHSCTPTVSSRGGQKFHPRMTNIWTQSTFNITNLRISISVNDHCYTRHEVPSHSALSRRDLCIGFPLVLSSIKAIINWSTAGVSLTTLRWLWVSIFCKESVLDSDFNPLNCSHWQMSVWLFV